MNDGLFLVQFGSLVVSLMLTRVIHAKFLTRRNRCVREQPSFFATAIGAGMLFGITFVLVWLAVSFLAVFAWWLLRPP